MKKRFTKLTNLLLTGALLIGLLAPAMDVQAEEIARANAQNKNGLKPMVYEEVAEEEMTATTKELEDVYVTDADIAYWSKFNSNYYYNFLLNDAEKTWWNNMEQACIAAAVGTSNVSVVNAYAPEGFDVDRFFTVIEIFKLNHPQYYFLSNILTYSGRNAGVRVYAEFQDGATRKAATQAFTSKIDSWVQQVATGARPEDKEKIAHDIIALNTVYNFNDYDQTAYSMVCMGQTVCAGYAATLQILLNAVGVDTIEVTGSNHAWNVVNLHGNWYQVDVTWDDTDNASWPVDYWCYNRSRNTYYGIGGHEEYDTWAHALTDAKYDMLSTDSYVTPYFTYDGNTYFVVNDNTYLGDRLAQLISGNGSIHPTVTYNGKTYTVPGAYEEAQIRAFVERMYTVALGRASDQSGIDYWTIQLMTHQSDGAKLSEFFIMSDEFKSKNYSNQNYLNVLYRTFFNREADAEGSAYWISQMQAGKTRRSILAGFVNSAEFDAICSSYGISRGNMVDDGIVISDGVKQFVERLYTVALERASDEAGLEEWSRRIVTGEATPEVVAKTFFLSEEYVNKNTSNDKYVETLYQTFMGRASEASGKAYWVDQLNQGMNRVTVLEGFAQAPEFKEIMARYGL